MRATLGNPKTSIIYIPAVNVDHMDKQSFGDALAPHYDDALRYCHTLAAKTFHTEAEDLFQESLLKAILRCHQLKEAGKFRPWFFQIITRTHISMSRRMFWRRFLRLPEQTTHIPEVYASYELTAERITVLEALACLTAKHRAALLVFELAGFTIEEIRVIQGDRSISAVKSRLARARKKLKAIILKQEKAQSFTLQSSGISNLDHEVQQTTQQALYKLNR